ncbi:MAG: metalloregulator ArsR/SmtB family transcription factor [Elsteraceae bacterium]
MESSKAAQIFAALSGETRLTILRLLIAAGPRGLAAGEIADRAGQTASAASFHLNALESAGLTFSTRQGRRIIHAVRIATLRALLVFLTETCCDGRPDLCGDLARLFPDPAEEKSSMTPAFNVLFLCTHNSARSIMAEAILNQIGGERFRAYSAGSDPVASPMPEVLERLRTLGHDVAGLHSKSWDKFVGPDAPRMDFVITLCDTLDGQVCPDFGSTMVTGAWPLPDPSKLASASADRTLLLNELYGGLHRRLSIFVNLPFATLDRMAMRARLDEIGGGTVAALERAQAN